MDDPLLVGVFDGVGKRRHQPRSLPGGLGRATQDVRQGFPRHVLEHQVGLGFGLTRDRYLAEIVEFEPGADAGAARWRGLPWLKRLASFRPGPGGRRAGTLTATSRFNATCQGGLKPLPSPRNREHPPARGQECLASRTAGPPGDIARAKMEASQRRLRPGFGPRRTPSSPESFEPSIEATALSPGSVERGQLIRENASLGPLATVEIGRNVRRPCAGPCHLPRLLEAIADRIDPRRRFEGELFVSAGPLGVHDGRSSSSCFQSRRMRLTLRSTVRGTQSSRAAISSWV